MPSNGLLSFQHYLRGLFAVANHLSAFRLFLGICEGRPRTEQLKLCNIATLTALLTMTVTLLTGQLVLEFVEISIHALRLAGGILLCASGMAMLDAKPTKAEDRSENDLSKLISVAIIPIGIPLTTGGGTSSTIILFSSNLANEHVAYQPLSPASALR